MKVMTTRHQLHMQLFIFNVFGLSLNLGVSNMATWKNNRQFNIIKYNVKVDIDSGDGVVPVNLTQGRCNNSWKLATFHMTICQGLILIKMIGDDKEQSLE